MRFFTGLHQPSDAGHFDAAFISVNRLRPRKAPLRGARDWIMDSGGYTEISRHGCYREDVDAYAVQIRRFATNGSGRLLAAVAQDWPCDATTVERSGLTVREHQLRTVYRYDALLSFDLAGVYLMPALQGRTPDDYVRHLADYGARLARAAWVAVGSLVSISGDPRQVGAVLHAIKSARPDLLLHGLGLKTQALADPFVRAQLETADSNAWSFHARKNGRNGNDYREALRWAAAITTRPVQHLLDWTPA